MPLVPCSLLNASYTSVFGFGIGCSSNFGGSGSGSGAAIGLAGGINVNGLVFGCGCGGWVGVNRTSEIGRTGQMTRHMLTTEQNKCSHLVPQHLQPNISNR